MIEVYTWEPNANSGKPLLMLKEKGAEFRYHYIDMTRREQHSPAYLALNPSGTLPTLVHDGLVLTESSAALEYLDEVLPGPSLRPREPLGRWRMRWWIRFLDLEFCPALAMFGGAGFSERVPPQSSEAIEQQVRAIPLPERRRIWRLILARQIPQGELGESQRRIGAGLALLERTLAAQPYLAGADYTLADLVALATVHSLPSFRPEEVNERHTPNLLNWLRRAHSRPAVRAAFDLGRGWVRERAVSTRSLLGLPG